MHTLRRPIDESLAEQDIVRTGPKGKSCYCTIWVECMAAAAGCHSEMLIPRMPVDPEVPVICIGIATQPRIDDRCICKCGECFASHEANYAVCIRYRPCRTKSFQYTIFQNIVLPILEISYMILRSALNFPNCYCNVGNNPIFPQICIPLHSFRNQFFLTLNLLS
jgi:hypothetical protein